MIFKLQVLLRSHRRKTENFGVAIKYFKFKTESNISLSSTYPATQKSFCFLFKPKQGLTIRQMLLKNDKHNVGAYLCRSVTVRLVAIINIYTLESDILTNNMEIRQLVSISNSM